jgi:hypothetical protein
MATNARKTVRPTILAAPVVVQGKLRTVIRKDGLLICK